MTTNNSPSKLSFSVPDSPTSKTSAKAQHIRRLNGKVRRVLWDIDYIFDIGEQWNSLTAVQKIMLEVYGTDKLLELIELYNRYVSHSIHYRLREKTPEEEEEEVQENDQ